MGLYIRAGMTGYQYVAKTIDEALELHRRSSEKPLPVAIVVSQHYDDPPTHAQGLPVHQDGLPSGVVYIVTDLGGREFGAPLQKAMMLL